MSHQSSVDYGNAKRHFSFYWHDMYSKWHIVSAHWQQASKLTATKRSTLTAKTEVRAKICWLFSNFRGNCMLCCIQNNYLSNHQTASLLHSCGLLLKLLCFPQLTKKNNVRAEYKLRTASTLSSVYRKPAKKWWNKPRMSYHITSHHITAFRLKPLACSMHFFGGALRGFYWLYPR